MAARRIALCGATALLGLWLAGCAGDTSQSRAWELAGQPGLLLKVQQYYETRAWEEGGRCTAPLMQGVARSEVLSDDPKQMVIRLDYYYRDWLRDDEDCDRLRPWRCGINQACRGFAQRIFFIDKGQDGLSVASMTGPQR